MKINIKRHDSVTTTFSDRLKDFKNVRRKFSKHKNKIDVQSVNEKFKHEKKNQKKKIQFLKLLIIIANKKNIMRLSVLMSLKMLK